MSEYIYNNYPNGNNNYNPEIRPPKKSKGKGIIALLCAICMIGSGIIGGIIGYSLIPTSGEASSDPKRVDSYLFEAPSITNTGSTIDPDILANGGSLTVAQTAAIAAPTVVEIKTSYVVQSYFQYVTGGAGSGVIIGKYSVEGTPSGYYIVTNAHVIQNSNGGIVEAAGITVTTNTGKEYPVHKVMGYDIIGDLAVLMVQTSDELPIAPIGDSDTLIIGEEVVAIGNPLGELGGTVTNGIISALDREIDVDGNKMNLLQTNAAINPGNSGGGLFNLRGELIGVVNAKSSGSGIEGLGFAIPSNDVKKMINDLIEFGYVKGRPYVGITVATDNYSRVYVYSLEKNYNDGVLQVHDQLLEANGTPIKSNSDFNFVVQQCKPGDTIELTIKRNRSTITVTITVFEKKSAN